MFAVLWEIYVRSHKFKLLLLNIVIYRLDWNDEHVTPTSPNIYNLIKWNMKSVRIGFIRYTIHTYISTYNYVQHNNNIFIYKCSAISYYTYIIYNIKWLITPLCMKYLCQNDAFIKREKKILHNFVFLVFFFCFFLKWCCCFIC